MQGSAAVGPARVPQGEDEGGDQQHQQGIHQPPAHQLRQANTTDKDIGLAAAEFITVCQ